MICDMFGQHSSLPQANWGYNTKAEREEANNMKNVRVIGELVCGVPCFFHSCFFKTHGIALSDLPSKIVFVSLGRGSHTEAHA